MCVCARAVCNRSAERSSTVVPCAGISTRRGNLRRPCPGRASSPLSPPRPRPTHAAGRAAAAWAPLPAHQHEQVEIAAGYVIEKRSFSTQIVEPVRMLTCTMRRSRRTNEQRERERERERRGSAARVPGSSNQTAAANTPLRSLSSGWRAGRRGHTDATRHAQKRDRGARRAGKRVSKVGEDSPMSNEACARAH